MPANQHLSWVEITDFAPGLWNANDWLVPAKGWQTMENAYPQEGGGLRAFHAGTAIATTGLTAATKERLIGLHARGGIGLRSGAASEDVDRYIVTYFFDSGAASGSRAQPRVYRMDGTNGESTWTEINKTSGSTRWGFSTTNNNAPNKASFRFMHQLAGSPDDDWVIAVIRYSGPDAGVYRFNYNDLSSAQKGIEILFLNGAKSPSGAIAIHQARLLVSNSDTIYFSAPGAAATSTVTDFLEVDPSQDLNGISALTPSPPSDLFVLRIGAAPVLVQGELLAQTSQVMAEGLAVGSGQDMSRTPYGYAFMTTKGAVYLSDGVTFTSISQQLKGVGSFGEFQNTTAGLGDLNYIEDFLFAPNGYVYHFPTKSWFTQTVMAGGFHNVERFRRVIWGGVEDGVSFSLVEINPVIGATNRVSSWHAKTAPLRSTDGRRIGIREVQLYVKSYDANATVTVTVNGVANTITCPSTGRQQLSFLFREKDEMLDVDIVSTAGGSAEAPSVEVLRIGFMPGTNLAVSE